MGKRNSGVMAASNPTSDISVALRLLRAVLAAMVVCIESYTANNDDAKADQMTYWSTQLGQAIDIIKQSLGTRN